MFQEDKDEVKIMIAEAIAKIPKAKKAPAYDDSDLKREIAELKDEVRSLKAKPKKIGG